MKYNLQKMLDEIRRDELAVKVQPKRVMSQGEIRNLARSKRRNRQPAVASK